MTTVKLRLDCEIDLLKERREFSSIVRISFNRFREGMTLKEVRAYVKPLFQHCGSWFVDNGILVGKQLYARHGDRDVVFGGRHNLEMYMRKLITRDEFRARRLSPITIQGERLHHGNRLFDFNLPGNELTLKLSRNDHRTIRFKEPHRKRRNNLCRLQELIDQNMATVTVSLTSDHVCLTFDESQISDFRFRGLKSDRVLGIDMNPGYIGLSVVELDGNGVSRVLHKQVFDLTRLTAASGESSTSSKSKYMSDKRRHETLNVAHDICRLVDYWKCGKVAVEDLSIRSSDRGMGRRFNRLCNNVWDRRVFVGKLESLSLLCGFSLVKVNPAYSSFVGNVVFGDEHTPDMVAASIEIARRCHFRFQNGRFFPDVGDDRIDERWKQTLSRFGGWKPTFQEVKKSKVKYRFLLRDLVQNAVLSKTHERKRTSVYLF